MTQHRELFAALAAPFEFADTNLSSGAASPVASVSPHLIMDRFDAVLGPENWSDDIVVADQAVICRLSIRLPDGTVLTKCGAASRAAAVDRSNSDSTGFVRVDACGGKVRGRSPAEPRRRGPTGARGIDGWADARVSEARFRLESGAGAAPTVATSRPQPTEEGSDAPRTGRALFAWTREQDKAHQFGLLDYLSEWAKERRYPSRMVDWDAAQVAEAYAEACVKLRSVRRLRGGPVPAMAR